jgi:hypothetical protein
MQDHQQADGHAEGKAKDVDEGKRFVPHQVPESDLYVIPDHVRVLFWVPFPARRESLLFKWGRISQIVAWLYFPFSMLTAP